MDDKNFCKDLKNDKHEKHIFDTRIQRKNTAQDFVLCSTINNEVKIKNLI